MKAVFIFVILVALAVPVFTHDTTAGGADVVELPDGFPVPTVELIVHTDPESGYNLQIKTTNFLFDAENVSSVNVMGHGHADISVDGEEAGISYGEWFHLASLPAGCHDVEVHLSANNHADYAHNSEYIHDTKTICADTTDLTVHPNDRITPAAGGGNEYVYFIVLLGGAVIGYLFGLRK